MSKIVIKTTDKYIDTIKTFVFTRYFTYKYQKPPVRRSKLKNKLHVPKNKINLTCFLVFV